MRAPLSVWLKSGNFKLERGERRGNWEDEERSIVDSGRSGYELTLTNIQSLTIIYHEEEERGGALV